MISFSRLIGFCLVAGSPLTVDGIAVQKLRGASEDAERFASLGGKTKSFWASMFGVSEDLIDMRYNFKYTEATRQETRGGEPFMRPEAGIFKIAINLNARYGGSAFVEGSGGDQWPVSYHGVGYGGGNKTEERYGAGAEDKLKENVGQIIMHGYFNPTVADGGRNAYGEGVYSTPNFRWAAQFGRKIRVDGHVYIVVMMNRVNPATRKEKAVKVGFQDRTYYITESAGRGEHTTDLRPYAILLLPFPNYTTGGVE